MARTLKSVCLPTMLLGCSLLLQGQIEPIPNLAVQPLPVPGGDITPGFGLFHQFFPGPPNQTPPFDPINSDPHGITNFRGTTAMGYTLGTATDNNGKTYAVITDIRVYQGEYVGGESPNPTQSAGYTKSARARGIFVEIWIDLWDVSLTSQLHDFSPGILPSGLFWIVKVPDSAVEITDNTLRIHLENIPEIDAFTFPPSTGNGITPFPVVPIKVSFDVTYTKTGNRRQIRPTSHDPLSPFNWAGEMWDATNSGTFSMTYDDGSFSASGSFSSSGNFGEMGTERNGSFLHRDDFDEEGRKETESEAARQVPGVNAIETSPKNAPRLKGRLLLSSR